MRVDETIYGKLSKVIVCRNIHSGKMNAET